MVECTMSMKFTLRAIPEAADLAVRKRARRESRSINAIVVEALARGLEVDTAHALHSDLDHLIGTWQEDPAFDQAVAEFERVDENAWE